VVITADHDEFVANLLRVMHPLMRAKVSAYNEADTGRKRFAFVVHPRHVISDAMIQTWVEHAHENPLLRHAQLNPRDFSVHKITDFISQNRLRQTTLCRQIYRKFGGEYQIALMLPTADGAAVALVFNRAYDFDERDRQLLALLQPIVAALYARIQTITNLQSADHSQTSAKSRQSIRRELKKIRLSRREIEVLPLLLQG
jgi:hypothetical protein